SPGVPQQRPNRPRHPLRLVRELPPGEANDRVAAKPELRVARPVGLEGGALAVIREGVGLDDQALGSPQKVKYEGADIDVHLGPREVVAATKGEHPALE